MTKLIFGCGYLGQRVAHTWLNEGDTVWAVTRSAQRADQFQRLGLQAVVADVTQPESLSSLPAASTVLFAVGYDRNAGPSIQQVYVDGLRNVLARLPAQVEQLIYVSSTGVYGQRGGVWVNETSPCHPTSPGGQACLQAEQLLAQSKKLQRVVILRMAGLYGPGRVPRRDAVVSGQTLQVAPAGYLNLIHIEDATATVVAAGRRQDLGGTFLVSDGHPVPRRDYYRYLAQLYQAPEPRFENPDPDSHQGQRALSDKRISNQKLIEQFGDSLRFPSYREGLAAIVDEQNRRDTSARET